MVKTERPDWCQDGLCTPLCSMETKGGGGCVVFLDKPVDHITENANNLSWCHYGGGKVISFYENKYDFILFVYLIGEAFKKMGWKVPRLIVENIPME